MERSFRGISLRPVVEDDLPFLFGLFVDPGRCHLWMSGRRVYDQPGFADAWAVWSAEVMAAKFIVESAGRPIGLCFDHDRVPEDGSTQVTALLEEGHTGHGGGMVATALLVDWLFRSLPLRKVYLKVYGYNGAVVRILRKLGLAEEGVLREDRYWDGAYWDLHVFALYRAAWPPVRARVLGQSQARPVAQEKEAHPTPPHGQRNGCLRVSESVS
jgi:RimJ/RimL family protein N-acetyltransferase